MNKYSWDTYYEVLCQIYKEQGTINLVFGSSFEKNGLAIGRWINRQRNYYSKGQLNTEKIAKLETIGFVWNGNEVYAKQLQAKWDAIFALAESYYKQNGNLRMPRNYIIDGVNVGAWLSNLKGAYRGCNNRKLSPYQISKLESIGIEWDYDYKEDTWNKMYECAKRYFYEHGNIFLPQGYNYEGLALGSWIHHQTQEYKKRKLAQHKIDKLNELGIRWYPQKDKWNTFYQCAKKYYKEIGNLDVPDDFEFDNLNLGRWISVQRQAYNGRQDTLLNAEQIKKLEAIGMSWKSDSSTQTSFYEQVVFYYVSKVFPSAINRHKELGIELDIYVPELNLGIEYDGYYWHKDKLAQDNQKDSLCEKLGISLVRIRECLLPITNSAKCFVLTDQSIMTFQDTLYKVFKECIKTFVPIDIKKDSFEIIKGYKIQASSPWYKAFLEAKDYYHTNGNLIVPVGYITSTGLDLCKWIRRQRQSEKGNVRPITYEQISLLDSIGMIWDPHAIAWEEGYSYAKMYFDEFHNLLVSQKCVYRGFKLGRWINKQRVNKMRNRNTSDRISKLEAIGMVWDSKVAAWEEGFRQAQEYFYENGNLLVHKGYKTRGGYSLGAWIATQRLLKKQEKLFDVQSRIDRLDTIGMVWNVKDAIWQHKYNIAKSYFEEHNNLLVPQECEYKNFKLGEWISSLRCSKTLSKEKIEQLNSIGMVWNMDDYSWEKHYSILCEYYNEFHTINVPRNTVYKDVSIGTWIKNIKYAKRKEKKSYLTDARIRLLEELGIQWN